MPTKYVPGRGFVTSAQQQEENENGVMPGVMQPALTPGMTEFEYQNALQRSQQQQSVSEQLESAPAADAKPFIGGGTVTDVLQAFPNAAVAIPTDILDLGAGLVDLAKEGYRAVTDDDYKFNESGDVFNDADNPWTQWRRENMGTSRTVAGEMVSTTLRLATLFVPVSGWLKGAALTPKAVNLLKFGRAAKLNKLFPAYRSAKTASDLARISKKAQKGSAAARATRMALRNPYLDASYKAVSNVPELGGWWKTTQASASAMFKTKLRFRNLAETVAWDVLGGFMIYGEGDDSMDETLFDFAASMGVDVPLDWQTTIQSTAVEKKLRGMLDGTLIGLTAGGLVDVFRIRRYASALKKASPNQRQEIIRAFQSEAEGLGDGVVTLAEKRFARYGDPNSPVQNALAQKAGVASDLSEGTFENFAKAQPGPLPEFPTSIDPMNPDFFEADGLRVPAAGNIPDSSALQLNTLVNQVERARQDAAAGIAAEGARRRADLDAQAAMGFINRGGLERGQPELAGTTTPGRAPTDSTPLDRAPFPDNAPGGTGIDSARVTVLGQSNVEATITPQTMRRAIYEALDGGMSGRQIESAVQKILPQKRVNKLDYILNSPDAAVNRGFVQRNSEGVIPAPDSIMFNQILEQGLAEGWLSVDPDTFKLATNRRIALDLDQADLANKAARGIDQAEDAARYEQYLQSVEPANPGSMRPEVQADLQAKDAAAEGGEAVEDGIRQAEAASTESQALSDEQLARMADEITAGADPDDVIADGLSLRPQDIPSYEVEKIGRQYQVLDPNGEPIEKGLYTTKKQANKRIERENELLKQGVLRRAQQQLVDGNFQQLDWDRPRAIVDGDVKVKVRLTDSQAKAMREYLAGDPSALPSVEGLTDFGPSLASGARTLELSQGQLNEIAGDIEGRIGLTDIDPSQRRVLKNLLNKLESAVESVAPEMRRQRLVDDVSRGVNRYLSHGDYC